MAKLRDVLPIEARGHSGDFLKYMDCEVIEKIDGCSRFSLWPGKEKNVYWWYKLDNGKSVGWNENPSRGWSFPVIGRINK